LRSSLSVPEAILPDYPSLALENLEELFPGFGLADLEILAVEILWYQR
jgi:hypothetical protein